MKKILSILLALAIVAGLSSTALAANPKGDADTVTPAQPLAEQFEELLLNVTLPEQRQLILEKAADMGIVAADLPNASLSSDDLAILNGGAVAQKSASSKRAVLTNPNPPTRVVVAGVDMPNYCLWPTIYKQSTSTYCSAGTVYTVGKYIGANPPAQASIMAFWQSQWSVTYPDLPLIRNYMNLHLPGKPSNYVSYVHKVYGGNQTTFNTDLKSDVLKYQPMILHMKNSSGTTNWPYTTDGHFCICDGLLTWESNLYFIGDPYYFTSYVSGATANNGEHKKTWSQLNTVITNRHGSGNQCYLT